MINLQKPLSHVPAQVTPQILVWCNHLVPGTSPVYINRTPNPEGKINKCTYNVQRYLQQNPGKMILGWEICIWDGVLLDCIGHAIVNHNDAMFCVTPSKYHDSRLLFLPDPNMEFDFQNPEARMPSKRLPLSYKPEVMRFIELDRIEYEIRCKYPVKDGCAIVQGNDALELDRISKEKSMLQCRLMRTK